MVWVLCVRLCLRLVGFCFNYFCIVGCCLLRLVFCIAFRGVGVCLYGCFVIGLWLFGMLLWADCLWLDLIPMLFGVIMFDRLLTWVWLIVLYTVL